MHFQRTCVFVAAVLALAAAADICDLCKCSSEGGVVKSVTCDCNLQDKVLNVTDDKLTKVQHVTDFAVSNCSAVNFVQSAFRTCHDLQRVTVSRVHTVTLDVGVFSALSSLHLEDVSDLRLAKGGFLGAELSEISFHRTNLSLLPSMALMEVNQLRKIEFKGVIVGKMEASAIKVDMVEGSQFIIDGCEMGTIEEGAVNIKASEVIIRSTLFENIKKTAVNVTASQSIDVMKNVFSFNCSNNGLYVHSNRITIDENTFNFLPIGLLTRPLEGPSVISFTNNIVYNFTLMSNGIDVSTMLDLDDFRNNEVVCDCELAKSVMAFKAFQLTVAPRTIAEQNYCYLESQCKMSLQQLSEVQDNVCDSAPLEDLCQSFPPVTTTGHPTRGGRAEGLPPAITTPASTHAPHTQSHKEALLHTAAPSSSSSASLSALLAVAASAMTRFLTS